MDERITLPKFLEDSLADEADDDAFHEYIGEIDGAIGYKIALDDAKESRAGGAER